MSSPPADRWDAGEAYEAFMGRWSRRLAEAFVRWLAPEPGGHWLDIGCGTGALSSTLLQLTAPASIVACDPSAAFVEEARRRVDDPRVSVAVAGAGSLPARPGGFDGVVSGLVLNFISEPARALAEMKSRTRPGGLVAATVWDYAGRMQFLRAFWDEAVSLDAAARELDEGVRFPMCRREPLISLFEESGMKDVASDAIEIPTRFESFDDFWQPFLGAAGPAPSYVASLGGEARRRLRARLERRLEPGRRGVIDLVARAWAVRGTVP